MKTHRSRIIAPILFCLFSGQSLAEWQCSEEDYEILKNTECFTDSHTGFAGTVPDHVEAYRCLLSQVDAQEQLIKLQLEGSKPAQLYAMIALRELVPGYYQQKLEQYLSDNTNMEAIEGCIVGNATVSSLFKQIDNGERVLKHYLER
ncbi:hypothetical protein HCH_02911 [Hahella chejuensis KCTC 2396]|uniref:Uncharacterized protein n=1 Tax=Hahella chejuensis (strain KCTC 2396) TaxID=349521 RepID=Q2SI39_HAHCH|nr:hypothetical protein [Hahella chejuensis]ABC29685.1 hypothetical protein HCH_02911 [Hahella chejuensis KCTC 2396]